jgi:hypothetical protein
MVSFIERYHQWRRRTFPVSGSQFDSVARLGAKVEDPEGQRG